MPNRIQPQYQIGPNNAGKMILRGCFMNVSRDWIDHTSGQVGSLLSRYLENRHDEATAIKLNYGEGIPSGREEGPLKIDIDFMATVVFRLKSLEKRGDELLRARSEDIADQVDEQVMVLRQTINDYAKKCEEIGAEPMFTGVPGVIIDNVLDRTPVTHAESMSWEVKKDEVDLFAGMTIHDSGKGYEPPSL
ncbi:hypothetical protein [Legionella jamestowniensis]|uniref:Uncharacterized protein n=1 Tax=Legionella jamestowniensis TaxID=455 RepID=A0A0W0UKP9_9GAMM|nr:hypothetical protein [Legionella jamestowniensis]KTD08316.1 hypothetical protein Ljam_2511 [Legionella jamestowniensis]OCH97157.1 hypothetical protein A8135_05895 [Legionella jamestowniensis]SFL49643.1 hypothetical protein SAMN02746073_0448 [Legionella jamestowniensis DSM 19215]